MIQNLLNFFFDATHILLALRYLSIKILYAEVETKRKFK